MKMRERRLFGNRGWRHAITVAAAILLAGPTLAQETGSSTAPMPEGRRLPLRIVPVVGASSFVTSNSRPLNDYDGGFSAGLFVDLGSSTWTFETGILTLNTRARRVDNDIASNVNSWGIPLLAKVNFTGRPQQSVFAKAGLMPFQSTGDLENEVNLLGLVGLGAAIPFNDKTSFTLDASYNHIVNSSSKLSNDYQGVALLAGVSIGM